MSRVLTMKMKAGHRDVRRGDNWLQSAFLGIVEV